jgi:membrane protein YdbS with pleckstrin-like domain
MVVANASSPSLLEGETVIWEGRPSWRAWPGLTILGFALLPILVGLFILATLELRKRSAVWKITNRRIEIERGWLSRHVDTIELWRVKDVEFRQQIFDRLASASSILITSHDPGIPALEIRGLPGDRSVYDQLMTGVMQARQQRGVMNLNQ